MAILFTLLVIGSPPLTRGKGFLSITFNPDLGITPAYAGKRVCVLCPFLYLGDHPRLRGEKTRHICLACMDKGSPPLTRGKVKRAHDALFDLGITPAYAGKRQKGSYQ